MFVAEETIKGSMMAAQRLCAVIILWAQAAGHTRGLPYADEVVGEK